MPDLIALIILFCSTIGMAIIIIRKIPVLVKTPIDETKQIGLLGRFKNKVKNEAQNHAPSGEVLLLKILSRFRILTLKIEGKTSKWLSELRQRRLRKKGKPFDNYWKGLKGEDKNSPE